jgi:phenylalanyl-tRNA synthetase beta subunit
VVYRDPEARRNPELARTLTDKEIDQVQEKVVARASRQFGATLRAS